MDHPLTWALPGGHAEPGEDSLATAIRETLEETGYDLSGAPHRQIYAMRTDWPRSAYRTHAFCVDEEFEPRLNWESEAHRWCALSELPAPMHWGIDAMMSDDRAAERLHSWLGSLR